jgi:putative oxygen-independent coproporphyrinogen III oxidase
MSSPFGLYIHLPFCESKCHYCNFASGVYPQSLVAPYLQALKREILNIEAIAAQVGILFEEITSSQVDTIYFGGGTPSFIAGEEILALMRLLQQVFQIAASPEVTIEVNPGSVDFDKIDHYLEAGINRVSIGMQTFQDDLLKRIGRSHRVKDALNTFELFRKRELANISVDVMAGLPGQTAADWQENLETVVRLGPEHVSTYMLEIHQNTQFGKMYSRSSSGEPQVDEDGPAEQLPPEDLVERFYLDSIHYFEGQGYCQYEISNFAKPGYESRHNLKYWTGKPYLGLGCSAHSCFSGKRWENERSVGRYIQLIQSQTHAIESHSDLSARERREEAIFLGLRLISGLDLVQFRENFGTSFTERYRKPLEYLQEGELIELSADHLRLTPKGHLLSNEVFTELLRQD